MKAWNGTVRQEIVIREPSRFQRCLQLYQIDVIQSTKREIPRKKIELECSIFSSTSREISVRYSILTIKTRRRHTELSVILSSRRQQLLSHGWWRFPMGNLLAYINQCKYFLKSDRTLCNQSFLNKAGFFFCAHPKKTQGRPNSRKWKLKKKYPFSGIS